MGDMDLDTDSLEDILLPPATAARTLGKFQPKARSKTAKPVPVPSKLLDRTQLIPPTLEPHTHASDPKCLDEKLNFSTSDPLCIFTNAPNLDTTQGCVNQPEASYSEPLVCFGKNVVTSECDQGGEVTDMFSMESFDPPQPLSTSVGVVGRFQPKAKSQSKGKLVTTSVADPDGIKSISASIDSSSSFAPEVLTSDLHPTQGPHCLIEETVVQAGVSLDRAQVSNSDAALQFYPDKSEAEGMAAFSGLKSVHDGLFQSSATSAEQAQGEFPSKVHLKFIKRVPAISGSVDAAQLIPPTLEPLPHAFDVRHLDEGLSLSTYSTDGISVRGTSTSEPLVTMDSLNKLDTSDSEDLIYNGNNKEPSQHNEEKPQEICSPVWESRHDDNQPALNTGDPETICASNISSSSCAPISILSEFHSNQESLDVTKEPVTTSEASNGGPQVSKTDLHLSTHADKSGVEATEVFSDLGSCDDVFFPPVTTAGKQVGKFQPKFLARSKERKDKRVPINICDAAETVVASVDTQMCFAQNEGTEMLASISTETEPSFLQMLGEESLPDIPHSSFKISDFNGDIQLDLGRSGEKDTSEILGLESLENISFEPVSTTGQSAGKFQPKRSDGVKNVKHGAPETSHGVTESLHGQGEPLSTESGSLEGHAPIYQAISLINSMASWACNPTPTDLIYEQANVNTCPLEVVPGRDILNEKSTSNTVEDARASKSSTRSRKRINMYSPDERTRDDWDLDIPDISLVDEAPSDNEYIVEDVSKQKPGPKKSKRPVTENEKPVRKRKKSSEAPTSTVKEPVKKKFPHTTKRNRRQVNKVVLETVEDEIDPKQLRIKDIIKLANSKNRGTEALSKPAPNRSGSLPNDSHFNTYNPFETDGQHLNRDGDEAIHNVQLSSIKLNYHSFSKRLSSRWSKSETELFYQAMRQFGTNFAMIQKLFPERTRHQMKLKFKNEERKHPLQVADALAHRSKDHSHFQLLIQKLEEEAKEQASKQATYDPDATLQDLVGKNEEERMQPEKEGQQEDNGCDGEVGSPDKFDEYEGHYEWDYNAASPQDTYDDF